MDNDVSKSRGEIQRPNSVTLGDDAGGARIPWDGTEPAQG